MARPTLIIRGVARPYWGGGGGPNEREIHWYWGLYDARKRLDAGAITGGQIRELISDGRPATLRAVENETLRAARLWIAEGDFGDFGKPARVLVTVELGDAVPPVTEARARHNPARRRRNPATDYGEITGQHLEERHPSLVLHLRGVPNPDYPGQRESTVSIPWRRVPVATLGQARRLALEFTHDYDLGAGNIGGGGITRAGKRFAYVSPNGRVWRYDANASMLFPGRR